MSPCSLFFSSKGNKLAEGNLDSNEYKAIDFQIKKNIKEFVFNTGLPINSVSWAYRGKNNIQDEPSRTQFFAVAHSLNSVDKLKTDENAFITLKALNMESFHKFGTIYDGTDYVGIYKIDFEETSQTFGVPHLIYFLEHKGGSCMELKWLPVNTSSSKEIGVLGLLTSDGKISIYSMPNIETKNNLNKAISLTPILEISIENVYFTQFAWYPLNPFDKLLVGDIVGNIYLYQIKPGDKNARMSASWIKLYQMAHTRDIKDLKWVPNFDSNGEMLFASCSEDGDTKIWNVDDTSTPLHIFSPTKRPLYSLLWDLGMSYLLTNGEGPALSTKILSFQNIKKFLQNLKEGTKASEPIVPEEKANMESLEMKYVTSFETTLKSSSSPFSPYIASSDLEGRIIYYNSEELRSNLIYGSKKTRNDEIEILSETELDDSTNPGTFSIKYKEYKAQASKTEKTEEKKGLPHHRVAINALEMNPNHLLDGVKKQNDLVHSMLASGNYLGILRVAYFYKP